MIVVEGPDGGGKTTLIKEIMSQFPVTLAPRVVSKDAEAMVDLVDWVEADNAKLNQGVIFDRHRLISECIYGPVLRQQTERGFDDLAWLESQMRMFYAKKPVLIYCIPAKSQVLDNVYNDPDNIAVAADVGKIYDLYVARASVDIACGRATLYDYNSTPTQLVMGTINREEMF